MIRLETFLEQWTAAREDAAQAVEDMPAGKLDFRPGDDFMSFRDVAVHIVDIGRAITGLLLDGVRDFSGPSFMEKAKSYARPLPADADGASIAAAMRDAIREHSDKLAGATPEFLSELITRWDGARLTRLEMLQFVKEHEVAHRMQMFLYLRMNGVVPPTTRRRQAQKK